MPEQLLQSCQVNHLFVSVRVRVEPIVQAVCADSQVTEEIQKVMRRRETGGNQESWVHHDNFRVIAWLPGSQ